MDHVLKLSMMAFIVLRLFAFVYLNRTLQGNQDVHENSSFVPGHHPVQSYSGDIFFYAVIAHSEPAIRLVDGDDWKLIEVVATE